MKASELTLQDIRAIAAWTPITPAFENAFSTCVIPTREYINQSGKYTCAIFDTMGNYAQLFVQKASERTAASSTGLVLYLSLMAPLGAYGWGTKDQGAQWISWPGLQLRDVCDPDVAKKGIERVVIAAVHHTSYSLLSSHELARPLPGPVHFQGYAHGYTIDDGQPVLMHALFRNDD